MDLIQQLNLGTTAELMITVLVVFLYHSGLNDAAR